MRSRFALATALALAADLSGIAPSLTADLDGDGRSETVRAAPAKGAVRLEVRDADGKKRADAKAPAPRGDVVPVTLTSGPLGSAGTLVEVLAATDTLECRTIWRYRDGSLAPLPIRDASGRALPDCAAPAGWTARWEPAGEGRPSLWIREKVASAEAGALRTREAFHFAGFSMDFDAAASAVDVGGIPIPTWYAATLYSRSALETLYGRARLEAMRAEPTLTIETDRARGEFALRFAGVKGELVARVDAFSLRGATATLGARAGDRTAHVTLRLGGDGSVPYEARVEGLGPDWDRVYSPAGAWRSARKVFPRVADELASEDLVGLWSGSPEKTVSISLVGEPPFRVRMGTAVYALDFPGAAPPFDLLLLPVERGGRAWGIVLKGPNALDRVPAACEGEPPHAPCRPAGEAQPLKRIGARVNVP